MIPVINMQKTLAQPVFKAKQRMGFSNIDSKKRFITPEENNEYVNELVVLLQNKIENDKKAWGKQYAFVPQAIWANHSITRQPIPMITNLNFLSGEDLAEFKQLSIQNPEKIDDFLFNTKEKDAINLTINSDLPIAEQVEITTKPELRLNQKFHS